MFVTNVYGQTLVFVVNVLVLYVDVLFDRHVVSWNHLFIRGYVNPKLC